MVGLDRSKNRGESLLTLKNVPCPSLKERGGRGGWGREGSTVKVSRSVKNVCPFRKLARAATEGGESRNCGKKKNKTPRGKNGGGRGDWKKDAGRTKPLIRAIAWSIKRKRWPKGGEKNEEGSGEGGIDLSVRKERRCLGKKRGRGKFDYYAKGRCDRIKVRRSELVLCGPRKRTWKGGEDPAEAKYDDSAGSHGPRLGETGGGGEKST